MNKPGSVERFLKICHEVEVNPEKILNAPTDLEIALVQKWHAGKTNDVKFMRSLRNLKIFNPERYR